MNEIFQVFLTDAEVAFIIQIVLKDFALNTISAVIKLNSISIEKTKKTKKERKKD